MPYLCCYCGSQQFINKEPQQVIKAASNSVIYTCAVLIMVQTFISLFVDLLSKDYKRGLAKMSPDQVKKARKDQKIKLYNFICFCGAGLITVMDKSALVNKLYIYDQAAGYKFFLYCSFSLLSMLLGIIASSFPETAPFAMEVSWNECLQAFLFAIACLHISVLGYHADMQKMFASFVLMSTLCSLSWYFFTKESEMLDNRDAD